MRLTQSDIPASAKQKVNGSYSEERRARSGLFILRPTKEG